MARLVAEELIYRAKVRRTGEIFEDSNFRNVYNAVRRTLKDYLHNWSRSLFDSAVTHIEFGRMKYFADGSCEFYSLDSICLMGAVKDRNKIDFYVERID